MIKIAALLCTCITLSSYGQTRIDSLPDAILSTKTNNHRNISGTKVFIVPPPAFKLSATLPILEKGNTGLIQVIDLTGSNFYISAAIFTREKFEKKGVKVFAFKELTVNHYPARLALIQDEPGTKVYNLIFGDSTFYTMIMGVFSSSDTITGTQVKQALETVYYDQTEQIDALAKAPFRLNDSTSVFKFAKFSAGTYVYAVNGVKKDAYDNDPFLMVLAAPLEGASLKGIANDMAGIMKNSIIKNNSTDSINGLPSFSRELYGMIKGRKAAIYQQVVVIGENAVVMQGLANDDFEKYLPEFKKLANTIRKNE